MSDTTLQQQTSESFQGFPRVDAPIIDPMTGGFSRVWYHFFLSLWRRSGSDPVPTPQLATVSDSGAVTNSTTGRLVGNLVTSGLAGAQVQPQAATNSPFVFVAGSLGSLVVDGSSVPAWEYSTSAGFGVLATALVELSRDGGVSWILASLSGGTFFMLMGDLARVSWSGATSPKVVYLPTQSGDPPVLGPY